VRRASLSPRAALTRRADERNAPPVNRTPEPDDIVASLLVRQGDDGTYGVDAATYEANYFYRPCTRDGVVRLNDELHRVVLAALERAHEVEQGLAEDARNDKMQ
jgi:hypothetical protein